MLLKPFLTNWGRLFSLYKKMFILQKNFKNLKRIDMKPFFMVALGVLFVLYVASVVIEALRRSKSVKQSNNNAPLPKQVKRQNYIRIQAEDLADWDSIDYLYSERPHVSSREVKLEINEQTKTDNQ